MKDEPADLNSLVEKAAQDVGCEAVSLFVNRPESKLSERVAYVGEEPRATVPFGVTPLGECAAGGPGVHREVSHTKSFKYHSHLYLPLFFPDGTALGVAWFAAVQPGFFARPPTVLRARNWIEPLTLAGLVNTKIGTP